MIVINKLFQLLGIRNTRRVLYSNQGREGYVTYQDHISSFTMYFEFGGGNCVAIISVPTEKDWGKLTGRRIEERTEILNFIAKQTLNDQVRNGYFNITDNSIELFQR